MSELRTIDQQALLTPDKPALVMAHDGSAVTFAELAERSARAKRPSSSARSASYRARCAPSSPRRSR